MQWICKHPPFFSMGDLHFGQSLRYSGSSSSQTWEYCWSILYYLLFGTETDPEWMVVICSVNLVELTSHPIMVNWAAPGVTNCVRCFILVSNNKAKNYLLQILTPQKTQKNGSILSLVSSFCKTLNTPWQLGLGHAFRVQLSLNSLCSRAFLWSFCIRFSSFSKYLKSSTTSIALQS